MLTPTKTYTAEEYLALEVESEFRHEYRQGDIIPITGGTTTHNELNATLVFLLMSALRKQPYCIFVTDQRLWLPERDIYTYPDVMVTQRPPELKPGRKDTVMNPILIAEVLSDSTAPYDRGEKFAAYRSLPTLQEYVLIAQDKPQVEQYVKHTEHQWLFQDYQGLEQTFVSVGATIPLVELYETVFAE